MNIADWVFAIVAGWIFIGEAQQVQQAVVVANNFSEILCHFWRTYNFSTIFFLFHINLLWTKYCNISTNSIKQFLDSVFLFILQNRNTLLGSWCTNQSPKQLWWRYRFAHLSLAHFWFGAVGFVFASICIGDKMVRIHSSILFFSIGKSSHSNDRMAVYTIDNMIRVKNGIDCVVCVVLTAWTQCDRALATLA